MRIASFLALTMFVSGCDDDPSSRQGSDATASDATASGARDSDATDSDATANVMAPDWGVLTKDDPNGMLLSTWGRSADEVYFVGGGEDRTAVGRWDGSALSWMENPGGALAWWIFGLDEQLFVVGDEGLGLRREGDGPWTLWDTGVAQGVLYGVWGTAADDLWVVGGDFRRGGPPRLRHWDGAAWADAELPNLDAEQPKAFFKVWGTGPDDVHVVGDQGVMLHFDGAAWSKVVAPQADAMLTVHGGAAGLWAVGGRAKGSIWLHQDGAWVDRTPPDRLPGLTGVFVDPDGTVLVSGTNGRVMERDLEGDWAIAPQLSLDLIHSVWKSADGASWAVGGDTSAAKGVILHRPAP